ncbi:MAG: aldo/keto reductase [Chthoniobacterales bacterium]
MNESRRTFLKTSAALATGLGVSSGRLRAASQAGGEQDDAWRTQAASPNSIPLLEGPAPGEVRKGDMVYRQLGSTGELVSLIGMGGFHLSKPETDEEAIKLIRSAIDQGITFMDNSWDYAKGTSELRAGKALRDGYRDKVFQMTKIDGRTKKEAARQIEESLVRLQIDHLDLLQHHEIIRMEDADQIFKEDGAMSAVLEAKKAGKVRFIGFTGHKDPLIHLRMLEVAKENDFHFDTVQMPLNVMDAHFRSFGSQVLPVLLQEKIAPLAMKTFGDDYILRSKTVEPIEALHFSMSLPVSVVITGIDKPKILEQALQAAKTYQPMDRAAVAVLLAKTKMAAKKGEFELYKVSKHFDATAENPDWLGYSKNSA